MNPLQFFDGYHSLFGMRGVWLAAQARLRQKCVVATVAVPGIAHPVDLRLRSSDVCTFRQVIIEAGYDCDFAKAPRTIVDAGANIGLTSVFYANKFPDATIFAIEPERSNFTLLKKNTSPYRNVVPLHAALWKNNEVLSVFDSGSGAWGFQTKSNATEASPTEAQEKCRGLTVDMLMKEHGIDRIDLLKIDIEGSEKEVFEGAGDWIEKVGAIAIELHDGIHSGCSAAFEGATKSFGKVRQSGETVFVSRPGHMLRDQSGSGSDVSAKQVHSSALEVRLPCRIISAFDF